MTAKMFGTGTFSVSHSHIRDNDSWVEGGGVFVVGGTVTLSHVLLTANRALEEGGALYLNTGKLLLQNAVLTNNKSSGSCGGIYAEPNTEVTIEGSILAYNQGYQVCLTPEHSFQTQWSVYYHPEEKLLLNASLVEYPNNLIQEPGFLTYDSAQYPLNHRLSSVSPIRDYSGKECVAPHDAPCDPGLFGGPAGAGWDLDGDGIPAYFWPGPYDPVLLGIEPSAFDCDDTDPHVPAEGMECLLSH
ncbi:MAG: hypothetical protein ACKO6N_05485 [Myxococcota bacterium]